MDIAEGEQDGPKRPKSHPQHLVGEQNRLPQVVLLEKRKEKTIASITEDLPMFAEKILSYTEFT